jgi:hypothetical protein
MDNTTLETLEILLCGIIVLWWVVKDMTNGAATAKPVSLIGRSTLLKGANTINSNEIKPVLEHGLRLDGASDSCAKTLTIASKFCSLDIANLPAAKVDADAARSGAGQIYSIENTTPDVLPEHEWRAMLESERRTRDNIGGSSLEREAGELESYHGPCYLFKMPAIGVLREYSDLPNHKIKF